MSLTLITQKNQSEAWKKSEETRAGLGQFVVTVPPDAHQSHFRLAQKQRACSHVRLRRIFANWAIPLVPLYAKRPWGWGTPICVVGFQTFRYPMALENKKQKTTSPGS